MGVFLNRSQSFDSVSLVANVYAESVLIESINSDNTLSYVEKERIIWTGDERGLWFELNISQRVIEWQKSSESNHGLKVSIELPEYLNNTIFSFISPTSTEELRHVS